jgi:hypothetical protein
VGNSKAGKEWPLCNPRDEQNQQIV